MKSNTDVNDRLKDEGDPITGVIGDSGKYQLLICSIIAFFEVGKCSRFAIMQCSNKSRYKCDKSLNHISS